MVKVSRRLPMTMAAAVPEYDAPAGRKVRVDRRVRMLGRVEIVAPVEQRRDAGIESFQAAEKIAGVSVFGPVKTTDRAVQTAQIVGERPVRSDIAEQGLPGVTMRIDHSGQHQA